MIHDEPRASLPCQERPHPLQENAQPEAGLCQEHDVYACPRQPCDRSPNVQLVPLQDGIALTDDGHGALVEVTKWRRFWFAGHAPVNQPARVATLLHRDLCDAAQWFAVLTERRGVADHEDIRMSRQGEVRLNAHAPGAINVSVQPFTRRRRRDTGGPDHRPASDPLAGDNDTVVVDLIDPMSQPHLHSQLLEPLLGPRDKSSA